MWSFADLGSTYLGFLGDAIRLFKLQKGYIIYYILQDKRWGTNYWSVRIKSMSCKIVRDHISLLSARVRVCILATTDMSDTKI